MSIADKLALLASTKELLRVKLGLSTSVPFSQYADHANNVVAFNPISLFIGGKQGFLFNPSDLSTLFQDAAGTIPVTASGQPVGKMLDKSGNNNHATQSLSAARPTYQTNGTLHWLNFDGVDDHLLLIGLTPKNSVNLFAGLSFANIESPSVILGHYKAGKGAFLAYNRGLASGTTGYSVFTTGETIQPATPVVGARYLFRVVNSAANNLRSAAINGRLLNNYTAYAIGDATTNTTLMIGNSESYAEKMKGSIYSMTFVMSDLSDKDVGSMNEYTAGLSGVVL